MNRPVRWEAGETPGKVLVVWDNPVIIFYMPVKYVGDFGILKLDVNVENESLPYQFLQT